MYSCRLKRIGGDPINPLKIEEPTSRGALPITGYDVTLRIGNLFMFALVRSLFLPTRQVLVCELSITLQGSKAQYVPHLLCIKEKESLNM